MYTFSSQFLAVKLYSIVMLLLKVASAAEFLLFHCRTDIPLAWNTVTRDGSYEMAVISLMGLHSA
jgi:hypothetical protein